MKRPSSRVLSLLLALVLSFSLCPAALADLDPSDYSDLKEDYWAYDSIMYCSEWEIVKGYSDGKFYPENPVSGVEFITMVTRTFYNSYVEEHQNANVKPSDPPWYWANMQVADDWALTYGVTVDEKSMNRYDMSMVIGNLLASKNKLPSKDQKDAVQSSIKDYSSVPKDRQNAIKTCYATGVLTGMSDGMFHGEKGMTRAQACVVITRMLNVINGETPGVPSQPQQPAQPETSSQPEPPQPDGSGLLANGQPATVENVQAILAEIEKEYPEGTVWGYDYTPNTNYYADGPSATDQNYDVSAAVSKYGPVNMKYGCGGFMCMVSERIFGKTGAPAREVTDITKARPGDIVVKMSSDGWGVAHVCIFQSFEPAYTAYGFNYSATMYTCDGNVGGQVDWMNPTSLDDDLSDLRNSYGQKIHILTRYPD